MPVLFADLHHLLVELVFELLAFKVCHVRVTIAARHCTAEKQRQQVKIKESERLVWDAVYALQKAGLDQEAGRLRRKLERL